MQHDNGAWGVSSSPLSLSQPQVSTQGKSFFRRSNAPRYLAPTVQPHARVQISRLTLCQHHLRHCCRTLMPSTLCNPCSFPAIVVTIAFELSWINVCYRSYACYTALIPDLVPVAHLGRASGVMAAMSMLGSLVGFTLFGFVLDVVYAYWLYCAALLMTVAVTCVSASEKVHTPLTRCIECLHSNTVAC